MTSLQSFKKKFISAALLSVCFSSQALAQDVITPDIQPDGQLTTPAPQPPLINAEHKKHYELQSVETTTLNNTADDGTGNAVVNQAIDNTPRPPLTDAQARPDYEAENTSTQIEQNTATAESPAEDVTAETTTRIDGSEKNEEQANWADTRPQRVSADWLQLTSGEWLRGRIIAMQKDVLEFDSDELDNLEIKWNKVRYIKSSEPYSLRFDDRTQATGAIEITQDEVHVATDYDDQIFRRSQLLSIASGHETEISKWTNKITFSINARRGNTNQTDFSSKINAKRRTVSSRLLLEYLGSFTEIENTETINNHRINITYDLFLSRNLFVTPVSAEFFRDPFLNIETRANIGIAIGYTIINTNESEWDVSGGPAYQETKFVSVQPGQDSKDSTATLILTTKFDTELNSKVDLEGTYSVTLGDSKTGGYTHRSILTIETELTDKLDFDVTGVWDRVKSPVQDQDGIIPERDDFRILIGLGYDL